MHSIVLLTAMTATSGLFGGGRQHRQAPVAYAPATSCQSGRCAAAATYAPAPVRAYAPAQHQAYAPAQVYAPAPRMAAAPAAYNAYYYPAGSSCATGNCPRR